MEASGNLIEEMSFEVGLEEWVGFQQVEQGEEGHSR